MKVLIVTPAAPGSRQGNRITALRCARFLRGLGHSVRIATEYRGQTCDILVALHAHRSHAAIQEFSALHPDGWIVVVLTGTDLYQEGGMTPQALASLKRAHRIVALHRGAARDVPREFRERVVAILQSVAAPRRPPAPLRTRFDVCVSGHLREVKDPFCAAEAARDLPESSRIRIRHLGGALDEGMAARAREEQRINPRYRWEGSQPRWKARRILAQSRVMVISSRSEGGAHVVSEAVVAGVPILASFIPGNTGLLGEEYPGYFPVGDRPALTALLHRTESEPEFRGGLQREMVRLQPLFDPSREARAWRDLLRLLS